MFQKARDTAYLESTSLLILIVRWKKPLIISLLIAGLLATFFSGPLFITPKYNSSVIFFPATTNSLSKAILEETGSDKQDILAFGEEEQAEQMLQILNSDEIREVIINKYNLFDHYHVNTSDNFPLTKLNDLFKDNISFSRTEFMSVRIDVMDEDPQLAANIANDISSLLDSMKTKIQHRPRSPSPIAPSRASQTACTSTSESECPNKPFECGTSTPPKINFRPAPSGCTSYPHPTRIFVMPALQIAQ